MINFIISIQYVFYSLNLKVINSLHYFTNFFTLKILILLHISTTRVLELIEFLMTSSRSPKDYRETKVKGQG
ncbi:uncharacterized protein DS421_19g647680 [Arachis hypogaea]|uniref:Uncharacterized protein n=1 Tax=Arachis hypogaea TaxID=3818 RepID=A0A6B9V687_ARAHY|nr:uncharacterized protein DS421_19g647680 [Arachis hypogaea]